MKNEKMMDELVKYADEYISSCESNRFDEGNLLSDGTAQSKKDFFMTYNYQAYLSSFHDETEWLLDNSFGACASDQFDIEENDLTEENREYLNKKIAELLE